MRNLEHNVVPVRAVLIEGFNLKKDLPLGDTHLDEGQSPFWLDLDRLLKQGEFWYATDLDFPLRNDAEVIRGPKKGPDGTIFVEVRQKKVVAMIAIEKVSTAPKNWDGMTEGVFLRRGEK